MKNLLKGIMKSKIAKQVQVVANANVTRLPICEMHDCLLNQGAYGKK